MYICIDCFSNCCKYYPRKVPVVHHIATNRDQRGGADRLRLLYKPAAQAAGQPVDPCRSPSPAGRPTDRSINQCNPVSRSAGPSANRSIHPSIHRCRLPFSRALLRKSIPGRWPRRPRSTRARPRLSSDAAAHGSVRR